MEDEEVRKARQDGYELGKKEATNESRIRQLEIRVNWILAGIGSAGAILSIKNFDKFWELLK
jgi:hypothetical protein